MRTQLTRDQREFIADQYLARNIGRPAHSWALLPECLTESDVGRAMERRVNRIADNNQKNTEKSQDDNTLVIAVLAGIFLMGVISGVFATLIVGKA